MDNASWMVNALISRLSPWYPIEFQLITDSFIQAKIGKYYVDIMCEDDEPYQGLRCDLWDGGVEAKNFVSRINGILAGKVRNDAGELVSA